MKKKDLKIIRQINKEAWDLFGEQLLKQEDVAPVVREVVELSLTKERGQFTQEQIQNIETLKHLGVIDMKEWKVDDDIAAKMDEYTQKRLIEEIKKGRLSNPKDDKLFKKVKQNARRKINEERNIRTKSSS